MAVFKFFFQDSAEIGHLLPMYFLKFAKFFFFEKVIHTHVKNYEKYKRIYNEK